MNKVPFGMYVSNINDELGKLQNCMIAPTLDSFALYVTVTILMHYTRALFKKLTTLQDKN